MAVVSYSGGWPLVTHDIIKRLRLMEHGNHFCIRVGIVNNLRDTVLYQLALLM